MAKFFMTYGWQDLQKMSMNFFVYFMLVFVLWLSLLYWQDLLFLEWLHFFFIIYGFGADLDIQFQCNLFLCQFMNLIKCPFVDSDVLVIIKMSIFRWS